MRILKYTVFYHIHRPRKELFCRLEHQLYCAFEFSFIFFQKFRGPQQHSSMAVMPAAVSSLTAACKGKPCGLFHRESVHISPQENTLSSLAYYSTYSCFAYPVVLDPHFGQFLLNQGNGLRQIKTHFGPAVDFPPDLCYIWNYLFGLFAVIHNRTSFLVCFNN